ncbi:MAG TPA: hypothetical protein VLG11_06325 [Candidatus Saccharimonadales bacterium]|nr:hypothetical protein [Candidatus Saccharimonadales bacterium]
MQKCKNARRLPRKMSLLLVALFGVLCLGFSQVGIFGASRTVAADPLKVNTIEPGAGQYTCGSGDDAVKVSINFGCSGKGTATADVAFAVIRVLSAGVGLVVIGSIVLAGIQYTSSRGDPSATSRAIGRIRSSLIALVIFIFATALLDFILPQGFLK